MNITIADKVIRKLGLVKENLEREIDEINQLNNWKPSQLNAKDQLMMAAKQLRGDNQESLKMSFLAKIDRFRTGKTNWIKLEKSITSIVHKKKWAHKTENEKKNNLAMVEIHQNDKNDYFRWRAKRDYKLDQKLKYEEFLEKIDTNQYFMYSRAIGEFSEMLLNAIKYLKFINFSSTIKLSELSVTLRDSNDDVINALHRSMRSCTST